MALAAEVGGGSTAMRKKREIHAHVLGLLMEDPYWYMYLRSIISKSDLLNILDPNSRMAGDHDIMTEGRNIMSPFTL